MKSKSRACSKYKPTDERHYKDLLMLWFREFHVRWLKCDSNGVGTSKFQSDLFFVKHNDFEDKMNPDIAGSLTKSILDASRILNYQCN